MEPVRAPPARLGDSAALRKTVLARNQPLTWSPRVGWWPAVVLFVLLVLGELVFNLAFATKPAFVGGRPAGLPVRLAS